MYRKIAVLFITLAFLFAPALPATTTSSNIATISLSATVPSSLTVSLNTTSLNFSSSSGVTSPTAPVSRTLSWNFSPGQATTINLTVYFTSTTALSSPSTGAIIPTSSFIQITSSGSGTCNQNQVIPPTIANTCGNDLSVSITSANLSGTSTTSSSYQIPSLMSFSPASDYAGVLNFQAFAN